jgi:hypothetical protein
MTPQTSVNQSHENSMSPSASLDSETRVPVT